MINISLLEKNKNTSFRYTTTMSMWINDGSLAKQSYAHAFAWSDESTFQKRDTSNISILRCSFHKTAKRLSITGLTHLLRLRTKIQSSIVKALIIKIPNNKKRQFRPIFVLLLPAQTPLCCWPALVIQNVILLQTKQEKKYEVSQIQNQHWIVKVHWQYSSFKWR